MAGIIVDSRIDFSPGSLACFLMNLLMENVLLFRLGKIGIIGLGINDATLLQGDNHHLLLWEMC